MEQNLWALGLNFETQHCLTKKNILSGNSNCPLQLQENLSLTDRNRLIREYHRHWVSPRKKRIALVNQNKRQFLKLASHRRNVETTITGFLLNVSIL